VEVLRHSLCLQRSKKVGDVDAGSKDDWDKSGSTYSIDIPVNTIIKEDTNNAELSIRATAQSTIDSTDATGGSFDLDVPDNGIRAVDSMGIQQYTGQDTDTVSVDFNTADNGDLVVSTSSDNPNAGVLVADDKDTSDSYDVLAFSIRNKDDADVDFNSLTFFATSSFTTAKNIVRRATLDLDGDTYTGSFVGTGSTSQIVFDDLDTSVSGNDTIDGTLSVELYGQTGHFNASGESVKFGLTGDETYIDAESSDNGDTSTVSGSALGKTQSIGVNTGITVAGNSNSASESYNSTDPTTSTGTFTLKFDVTANGNDVYIPKTIATTTAASSTAGVVIDTNVGGSTTGLSVPVSLSSSADQDGTSGYYIVHDGDTETFTAQVTFNPSAAGYYQIGLDKIRYNDNASVTNLQTLDVDQTNSDYQTQQLYIH